MTTDDLIQRLLELGYDGLFLRSNPAALEALWDSGATRAQLARVTLDETAPLVARFLSSEILFQQEPGYAPPSDRAALASIYVAMLAGGDLAGNAWGLPGEMEGEVGQHLLALGEPAIATLTPLLADATPVWFEGSEEATTGNAYQLRVMDLAAAFISQLRGDPWSLELEPARRDPAIARLRASLT